MKELFYFEFADLMVNVEYIADTNSIRYSSHRCLTFIERQIIERYLLQKFALKTDYYKRSPSFLVHTGRDKRLLNSFRQFKQTGKFSGIVTKEQTISKSVDTLIHQSMKVYYFEKIGDMLLDMKNVSGDDLVILKSKLQELIDAYNVHSEKTINLKEFMK